MDTSLGEFRSLILILTNQGLKERKEDHCKYIVKDNIVRFEIKDYDPSATLVIDPTLIFCSFAGSSADNWGFTATYGPDGSFYGGGVVFGGSSWPVSPGAFQTVFKGGDDEGFARPADIGIIKFSPNGGNRIYATYMGGNGK